MRTTVIIKQRGQGYVSSVQGKFGGGHSGARCGLTPYEAAASAADLMIRYAQSNPEGGDLMAPPEVMELVPLHLRSIGSDVRTCERCGYRGQFIDDGETCPQCLLVQ